MSLSISVIICTYNPKERIFKRCLDAITVAAQSFQPMEILIIDNNSSPELSSATYIQDFLKSNSNASIIIEKEQGLTPARLRGIRESRAELLIFIDDDNVIESSFFKTACNVAENNKMIGAFSGQVFLDFEETPPSWTKKYWGQLVFREFKSDVWSNLPNLFQTMPCGAGLCVRKIVADHYLMLHNNGKRPIQLDRKGKSFFSGGDNDLSACACDVGLGMGLFHSLKLDHIIPAQRLEKKYLLNLTQGIAASSVVFKAYRGELTQPPTFKRKVADIIRLTMKGSIERDFYKATLKGEEEGRQIVSNQLHENNSHS